MTASSGAETGLNKDNRHTGTDAEGDDGMGNTEIPLAQPDGRAGEA